MHLTLRKDSYLGILWPYNRDLWEYYYIILYLIQGIYDFVWKILALETRCCNSVSNDNTTTQLMYNCAPRGHYIKWPLWFFFGLFLWLSLACSLSYYCTAFQNTFKEMYLSQRVVVFFFHFKMDWYAVIVIWSEIWALSTHYPIIYIE